MAYNLKFPVLSKTAGSALAPILPNREMYEWNEETVTAPPAHYPLSALIPEILFIPKNEIYPPDEEYLYRVIPLRNGFAAGL